MEFCLAIQRMCENSVGTTKCLYRLPFERYLFGRWVISEHTKDISWYNLRMWGFALVTTETIFEFKRQNTIRHVYDITLSNIQICIFMCPNRNYFKFPIRTKNITLLNPYTTLRYPTFRCKCLYWVATETILDFQDSFWDYFWYKRLRRQTLTHF